jgi:uncharacterized repeat protein (TIGR01451 family)
MVVLCLAAAIPLFAQSADQEITASAAPEPVVPGNNLIYTIVATNHGPNAAVNGGINGALASALGAPSFNAPAGFTCFALGANFSCTTPSFASGATATVTVTAQVSPSLISFADGSFSSIFAPSGTTADPNPGNNSKTVTTNYVTPDADVAVNATDSPDPVAPNNNVTYTVHVTNAGPDPAVNVNFNVVYNGGTFTFVSRTLAAGWTCGSATIGSPPSFTCTKPSLAAGADDVFTVVVKADPAVLGLNPANVQQAFTVNTITHDTNHANDAVTVTTQYKVLIADLGVTASGAPPSLPAGSNVTFTGTVANAGGDAAPNAHFTVLLDPRYLFQSITAPAGFSCTTPAVGATGTVDCTIASFAVTSLPFTIVAKVNPALLNTAGGTIDQGFSTGSGVSDPQNANNVAHVFTTYTTPHADLEVTNGDKPDPAATGGTITYTQLLTNHGPDGASNVTLAESIGSGVTFQSLLSPAGFNCTTPAVNGAGAINCTAASMANGATATFTVVVKVTAASGTVSNTAAASSDNYDPAPGNNSATAVTTIPAPLSADISVTKTTAATSITPGGTFSYTIAVSNAGPDPATSVVMTDALPASLLFQSITTPSGFSCTTPAIGASGTISCTAASLASGVTRTFTLTVQVAPAATGSIINSASVAAAEGDPTPGNGSVSAGALAVIAAAAAGVPALGGWALVALALLLGGWVVVRAEC